MFDVWKWLPAEIEGETEVVKGVIKQEVTLALADLGLNKAQPKTAAQFWALPEYEPGFLSALQVKVFENPFAPSPAEAAEAIPAPGAISGPPEAEVSPAEPAPDAKTFLIPMKAALMTRLEIDPKDGDTIFQLTDREGGVWKLVSLYGFVLREKLGQRLHS